MYTEGIGVTKNYVEATRWWKKAAEQGHVNAQHNLGIYYVVGKGVEKDDQKGYKLLLLAAGSGHEKAKEVKADLEADLDSLDKVMGSMAAVKWRQKREEVLEEDSMSTQDDSDS